MINSIYPYILYIYTVVAYIYIYVAMERDCVAIATSAPWNLPRPRPQGHCPPLQVGYGEGRHGLCVEGVEGTGGLDQPRDRLNCTGLEVYLAFELKRFETN